jgi:hypothetical protein
MELFWPEAVFDQPTLRGPARAANIEPGVMEGRWVIS